MILDGLFWVITQMYLGLAGVVHVLLNAGTYFDYSDKTNLMRLVHYGASTELFFALFNVALLVWIIGWVRRDFLWGVVCGMEGFANTVGRIAAWAGLLMVLQQIMVVFLQSIFRIGEISIGPFGVGMTESVGWWGDSLKLWNAVVVCLCCAWTFTQRGHVRVDLVYANVSHRTKRLIDMGGALFFMIPALVLTYFYAWFFLWRHLINPKVNASDTLERTLMKARAVKWNVETIGFSPNGFDGYILFKFLLLGFCVMMIIQAVAFFYRSFLEYVEGEDSADKFHDPDKLGDETAERAAEIH
ncbi:TRAP transporter small permease subunit [Tropicimonas sp. S265A]|uniref:TRAP transporter small permease subunit n=1 Tax=Tropicimonas sp. S265A TaxID=3415134 RepID=UPI003C7C75B8